MVWLGCLPFLLLRFVGVESLVQCELIQHCIIFCAKKLPVEGVVLDGEQSDGVLISEVDWVTFAHSAHIFGLSISE